MIWNFTALDGDAGRHAVHLAQALGSILQWERTQRREDRTSERPNYTMDIPARPTFAMMTMSVLENTRPHKDRGRSSPEHAVRQAKTGIVRPQATAAH